MSVFIYYPPPNPYPPPKVIASSSGHYGFGYALTIHLNRFINSKPNRGNTRLGFSLRNFLYSVGYRAPPFFAFRLLKFSKEVRCMDGS